MGFKTVDILWPRFSLLSYKKKKLANAIVAYFRLYHYTREMGASSNTANKLRCFSVLPSIHKIVLFIDRFFYGKHFLVSKDIMYASIHRIPTA